MADATLKSKIRDVLKGGYFHDPDDAVYVLDGDGGDDDIHVVIVSQKFNGERFQAKHDLIWSQLVDNLAPDEWGQVSITIGHTPEALTTI